MIVLVRTRSGITYRLNINQETVDSVIQAVHNTTHPADTTTFTYEIEGGWCRSTVRMIEVESVTIQHSGPFPAPPSE